MGLDMYLTGEIHFLDRDRKRGELKSHRYDLGYWRKHPNLHGYLVQHFADGVDDCREIDLGEGDLEQVLEAIQLGQLPHTVGSFFGESDGSERERDLRIFSGALNWLNAGTEGEFRSASYRASW